MNTIYVLNIHDELLHLWRSLDAYGLRMSHLDFHCDMRGLLINRRQQYAFGIDDFFRRVDQGNYLAHAILEKRVESLCWFHRIPGGREYDFGTVKYETDPMDIISKRMFFRNPRVVPFQYKVFQNKRRCCNNPDEFLDIDWDHFACKQYPVNSIAEAVEDFFRTDFAVIPKQVSLCYSPEYSHPTRTEFEAFIARLADIFQAQVIRPTPPSNIEVSQRVLDEFLSHPKYPSYYAVLEVYRKAKWFIRRMICWVGKRISRILSDF